MTIGIVPMTPSSRRDTADSDEMKFSNDAREQPLVEEAPPQQQSFLKALYHESSLRRKEVVTFWLLFILGIAFGAGVSYGVLGPIYLKKDFESTLPEGYGSGIYLLGVVQTLDLDSASMGIQWLVYGCEETGPYSGCNALLNATNFFVDGNAAPSSPLLPGYASTVYRADLTGYITDGFCLDDTSCWQEQVKAGVPYEQTIQTSHQFAIRNSAYNWRSNSQAYPFDTYTVQTTFLGIDPATNSSRNILGVALTGTVPNYSIDMKSREVTNPNYPYEWRAVTISIARAQIVIGYAFLLWTVNWLMTGVVMWITISAVQGRRRIPGDLFGIPITALFALPTVRSVMPGAPFFGCILDYSGIILNLAILTGCSISLLLSVIARDAKELYSPDPKPLRIGDRGSKFLGLPFVRRRSAADPQGEKGLGLSENGHSAV